MNPRHQINEIIPNLYITSIVGASDYARLDELGITHIVNLSRVNNVYPRDFIYLKIDVADEIDENIIQYFDPINDFIHSALINNGRVIVHCKAGKSRSSAVVTAYICAYYHYPLFEALDLVKRRRSIIRPNLGFMTQLIWYTSGSQ